MRFIITSRAIIPYLLERWLGLDGDTARRIGPVLSQGGEFALVLFAMGAIQGMIGEPLVNLLKLALILSMATRPMTLQNDPVSIALKGYQAYADQDRNAIEAVIAHHFHFTSSLDHRIDRETYFKRCWPNSETIAAFEFINLVNDGERAGPQWRALSQHRNFDRAKRLSRLNVNSRTYFCGGAQLPLGAISGQQEASRLEAAIIENGG